MSKKKEYNNKNDSKDQKLVAIQKESIIKIQEYMDKFVVIKFLGGRQVQGKLKSCDPANNIILSDCIESLRDIKDPYKLTGDKRDLGCVVIRGSMFLTISPLDGLDEIENPFLQQGTE